MKPALLESPQPSTPTERLDAIQYMNTLVVHDGLCRDEECTGECVPERPEGEA